MWSDLLADLERYPGGALRRLRLAFVSQGFWAVVVYRLGRAAYRLPAPLRLPATALWKPLGKACEVATGIELSVGASVGPGLYIGHFGGIIVSSAATLGRRCNLSHGVTIGVGGRGERRGVPVIGDRVYVGPGAKLFGRIVVGSDAAIGANAVVNEDVPPGTTVAGIPARIVSTRGSLGLIELGQDEGAYGVEAA